MVSGLFLTFVNGRVIVDIEFRRIFKEAVMTYLMALLCSKLVSMYLHCHHCFPAFTEYLSLMQKVACCMILGAVYIVFCEGRIIEGSFHLKLHVLVHLLYFIWDFILSVSYSEEWNPSRIILSLILIAICDVLNCLTARDVLPVY